MSEVPLLNAKRKHILTIVLEDYFQVGAFQHLIPSDNWNRFETRLKRNLYTILELLEATGNKATFFTCGWIADNHPELLQVITRAGHEVACQGYFHYALGELSKTTFNQDLERSRNALEDALGSAVHGFRIGRGWVGEKDLWLLDQLIEQGFSYDSSLCRIGREFWSEPFRAALHQHRGEKGAIYEVPVSSLPILQWSLPISGGNYFRQLPHWLLRGGVDKWIRERSDPLVIYFHTWELDPEQPKITAANAMQQIRHYRNLSSMQGKIKHYLDTHQFSSIAEYLGFDTKEEPARKKNQFNAIQASTGEGVSESDKHDLTLVIPCFNEAATLPYLKKTLDRFEKYSEHIFKLHYILIDDGSSDDTWHLMQQLFSSQAHCKLIAHSKNKGIAGAILTGFQSCRSDLVSVIDADCTFAPDQLIEMIKLLQDDVDLVVASPAHEQGAMRNVNFFRAMLSKGSAFLYRCVLSHQLTSYTSCFRLYRRSAVENLSLYNLGFCGVTEILGRLDLAGYRIQEYPAVLEIRLLGDSKINVLKTTSDHLKLLYHLAAKRWFNKPMPERIHSDAKK